MKTLDYIFLARPVLLGPVWTIFLLGAFHASPPGYLPSEVAQNINIIRFAAVFITFSLLVSSIYVFNQIMDLDSDRHNKKLFILADGIVSESSAIKYALLLTFIPLITAPFMGHRMLTVYAASALTGVLYNFRPFLFKNRPVSGLLSNMAGHGFLVFFAGYLTIRPEASFMKMAEQALPYALAVGSVFLCTTIPDIKGDERYGKITLPVKYGIKTAKILSLLMVITVVSLAFGMEKNIYILSCGIFAVFSNLAAFLIKNQKGVFLSIKGPVFLLSVFCVFSFPWYALLLLIVYVSAKYYYKKRFNLDFPNLNLK